MKTLSLGVGGKNYDVSLEDDFADYLENVMEKFYLKHRQNDIKSFLSFFIELVHEEYETDKNLQTMIEKIENTKQEGIN